MACHYLFPKAFLLAQFFFGYEIHIILNDNSAQFTYKLLDKNYRINAKLILKYTFL